MEKLPTLVGSLSDIAKAIVKEKEVEYEHNVIRSSFEETIFKGYPAIRFEFAIVATYTGDFGSLIVDTGYLMPHPCEDSWIAIYYTDHFRESAGELPDLESRRIGEEFLESLRIECD
ncbi:hypothetical protein [Pelagicoccus sp. SDUM812005]|uniref:hypothetical protein n=1 Tax=Pelagicoccus sp. SDUM812005 TaxID=3041257 RepID=UPI00280D3740|nr:hypothetical protein [Pelagicoccus sp. SDUM812005]MDQ8182221.1 hypothetical protein [Pelagicoccus sp. SDUM812005]